MSVESPSTTRPGSALPPLEPAGRAAFARAWNNNRIGVVLLGVSGALFLVVALTLTERIAESGHVLRGVEIGDVNASGMSEQDALAAVNLTAARLESTPIQVKAGTTQLAVDPTAIGLHVDAAASVRAARRNGRSHNPLNQLAGTILRRMRPDAVPLVVDVDPGRFDAVLDAWVAQTGKGLVDGGLRFEGTRVIAAAPKSGIGIQRAQAKSQVLEALGRGKSDAGGLTIGPTSPAVGAQDVRDAAQLARQVLSAPTTVTVNATRLILTPQQVAPTLQTEIESSRLVLRADPQKLRVAFGPALGLLETPPKDAGFAINGTSVSVVPAVTGKLLNLEQVGRRISGGSHAFAGNVEEAQPARTTEWAKKLNITELVSSFTTNHAAGQPRVTNIHRGADVINGTIVPPGGQFSLNTTLGPRTVEKGYVTAPQIAGDLSYEDAVGGGVSQLSTTLYNATFFGCYQDITHSVHSLYISRYPMGREATLNYPGIDNVFKNDSPSGILIRAFYSSTSVTVAFYGNKGGRTCRAEGPHVLQTIPPETEFVDDPSQPVGYQKVLETGHTGYVVENFRIISVPGKPDRRERYTEHYSTTKTKVARGTGGALPAVPAPTPTTLPVPPR